MEGILSANILKQRNVFLQDTICLDISLPSEMNSTKSTELHDGRSDKDRHSSLSDSDQRNSSFSSEKGNVAIRFELYIKYMYMYICRPGT